MVIIRFLCSANQRNISSAISLTTTLDLKRLLQLRHCTAAANQVMAMTDSVVKRYDDIIKSAEDKRFYRGLLLKNGLKALLISDPSTDKSAAAMSVGVGQMMDPWELTGLAHFCEHMLFLGTDKYPSENEYSKYISSHGGSTNAYTSSDTTNYHFDIAPPFLKGGLDRFIQFFLAPQFTENATEREVLAINSENENYSKSDVWRLHQLLKSLSKPGHDFRKFGVGSRASLWTDAKVKGIDCRAALLKFHNDYYSSDIMSFCVLGRESLDELENITLELGFGNIAKKNLERKIWNDHAFGEKELAKRVDVVSIKDLRNMELVFPVPDYHHEYCAKPGHYVSHLIGHEGPGSLLSELKRRGWVNSLSSGVQNLARNIAVFVIKLDLSEDGLEHTDDIVKFIFHEIGLIKKCGPLEWIHEELRKLSEIKFRFKDKEIPGRYVTSLSSEMELLPFEDIICADYKLDQFKPDLIQSIYDALTPKNMLYSVISHKLKNRTTNAREEWYGTEYKESELEEKFISECCSAIENVPQSLSLPPHNEYIATQFDLKLCKGAPELRAPRLVKHEPWCSLWFMEDNEFKLPKCSTKIALHMPMVTKDPMNTYLAAMYVNCLEDAITEEVYSACLAGLNISFLLESLGLSLKVSGYDEKQGHLVSDLIRRLVTFVPDEKRYEILKENFCRAMREFCKSQPYAQSQYYLSLLLCNDVWTKEELLYCANHCDVDRLRQFINDAFKAAYIEALVYGNKTEEEAQVMLEDVVQIIRGSTNARPLFLLELAKTREHQLTKDHGVIYDAYQSTHSNSCVSFLIQCGVESTRANVLLDLFAQIACEPAFHQLRTKEQLGYIVHTGIRKSNGIHSLTLLVQGDRTPALIEERIESFLVQLRGIIENMSDSEFKDNVEALVAKRLEKPKTINAKASRFWSEICNGFYHFNRDDVEVPVLKDLTKSDILQFYDHYIAIGAPERRKLCIMVHNDSELKESDLNKGRIRFIPHAHDDKNKMGDHVHEIQSFKSGMMLYPSPQPVIDIPRRNFDLYKAEEGPK